jgi:YjbE family integral membrane protein
MPAASSQLFFLSPEFWLRCLGIVLVDLALAGDNALVIAMAVRTLPRREQFWGRMWGSFGAVALRLGFIAIVTALLKVPLLQCAGGLLLLWIAVKLVRQDEGDTEKTRAGASVWEAVWIIIVADVIMSLDNVIAVAGLGRDNFLLVVFGIALSLPLVVWGSGLLARLMNRWRWIVWLGGGILGYVAGELIFKDALVRRWLENAAAHVAHGNEARVIGWLGLGASIAFGAGIFILGCARGRAMRRGGTGIFGHGE